MNEPGHVRAVRASGARRAHASRARRLVVPPDRGERHGALGRLGRRHPRPVETQRTPRPSMTNSSQRRSMRLEASVGLERAHEHRVVPVHGELVLIGKAARAVRDGVAQAAGGELPRRALEAELGGTGDGAAQAEIGRGGPRQKAVAGRGAVWVDTTRQAPRRAVASDTAKSIARSSTGQSSSKKAVVARRQIVVPDARSRHRH